MKQGATSEGCTAFSLKPNKLAKSDITVLCHSPKISGSNIRCKGHVYSFVGHEQHHSGALLTEGDHSK